MAGFEGPPETIILRTSFDRCGSTAPWIAGGD
jgi:hypothetical protein